MIIHYLHIAPLVLMVKPSEYNYLLVRIDPGNISRTLKDMEWQKFDDLFTFEYSFLAVTYQSIRASRLKPVDSLRYE